MEHFLPSFFACVNKFYTCGYMLSKSEAVNYDSAGVKIGFGVDLSQYNEELWKTRNMPTNALDKVKAFFNQKGKDAEELLLSNKLELDYDTVYDISLKHLMHLQYHIESVLNVDSKLNKTQVTTPLLSVLLSTNESESSLRNAILSRNVVNIGYIIENLVTNLTFQKQAQAFAITALSTECHSKTLISLVVDTSKTIYSFNFMYLRALSEIIRKIPFEFAFVAYGDKGDVVFDFTRNTTYMDHQVDNYQNVSSNILHAEQGLIKADELFTKRLLNESEHYRKVMVLIVTKELNDNITQLNELIMTYKRDKHYHVILITSEDVTNAYSEQILNEQHNIIYINTLQNEMQEKESWLPGVLYTSICRQHIRLTLGSAVTNLRIGSILDVHYFELLIANTTATKYIVWLHIHDLQDMNYNVYISTSNPFPNVNEHDVKHLGNIYDYFYRKATQPYLVLSLAEATAERIFISVESDNLYYNITIDECDDGEHSECSADKSTSNGLYGQNEVSLRMGPKSNYYSFTNCYEHKCLIKSRESLMKYFSRGLTSFNTNDNENEDNTYFNSNLFTCLYSLFYCVYIDEESGALIGHPDSIELQKKDPFTLLVYDFFPRLLINKIRPLLIRDKEQARQVLTEENIYFTREDTLVLYNVTRKRYLDSMNHSLERCAGCPHVFYQLETSWRFILFMNKFESDKDFDDSLTYVSNMNSDDYLTWRFKSREGELSDNEFVSRHIQNILIQSMNSNSREKCLISLVVGKSLAYTEQFLYFYKYFVDSLIEQKVSLTLYNEENKRLERVVDFAKASDETKTKLENYKRAHKESKQPHTPLDIDYIINQEIPRFTTYDRGIKRVIVIIGDERFTTRDGTYISHDISLDGEDAAKLSKTRDSLKQEQVNLMLITSISPDVKYKHYEDAYSKFFKFEEVYPLVDFSQLQNICQSVATAIRQIVVQIPPTFEIINDYYKDNLYYYEIELSQVKTKYLLVKFNSDKVNVYYSFLYPYPNKFVSNGNCSASDEDPSKCEIAIGEEAYNADEQGKLYLTFEPTENVVLLRAKICESNDSKKCNNVQEISIVSIVLLILSGFGLFVYGLASCNYGEPQEKKKINIFN